MTEIVQRLGAAYDAAQSSQPGSSLAAVTAERHRYCWHQTRLAALRPGNSCPAAAIRTSQMENALK
jgi:hypothetical protein